MITCQAWRAWLFWEGNCPRIATGSVLQVSIPLPKRKASPRGGGSTLLCLILSPDLSVAWHWSTWLSNWAWCVLLTILLEPFSTFWWCFSHLHLQTGAQIGPLSPSLGQIEGLWKRTPKSSSAVKQDLHGLGWVQTESEKSKANKLTHRHTHAFRANIERSRAFLTITRLINIVELITHLERMFTCNCITVCSSGAYPGCGLLLS